MVDDILGYLHKQEGRFYHFSVVLLLQRMLTTVVTDMAQLLHKQNQKEVFIISLMFSSCSAR